jgi:MerR family mercuric resistance operon transcriptional regulator
MNAILHWVVANVKANQAGSDPKVVTAMDQVRALIQLGGPEKASCREVRTIAAHHLEDIRAKLRDLNKLEHLLAKTVARCSGKTAPYCPVLDILDIQRSK